MRRDARGGWSLSAANREGKELGAVADINVRVQVDVQADGFEVAFSPGRDLRHASSRLGSSWLVFCLSFFFFFLSRQVSVLVLLVFLCFGVISYVLLCWRSESRADARQIDVNSRFSFCSFYFCGKRFIRCRSCRSLYSLIRVARRSLN